MSLAGGGAARERSTEERLNAYGECRPRVYGGQRQLKATVETDHEVTRKAHGDFLEVEGSRGDIVGVVAKLDSNYGFASIRVSSYPSLFLKKRATI